MADLITQKVQFDADPDRVYKVILDGAEFAKLTNASADIGQQAGDAFSAFNGMITGRQIELQPGRRIVQAWRVGNWPEGQYSLVTFELEPAGSGTQLNLRQSGHPEGQEEHLSPGWTRMYWDPIRAHLKESEQA